jgi:hypothetical protein
MKLKRTITGAATLLTIFCGVQNASLASPLGYVMNNLQFGTVDIGTGVLQQIGPDLPEAAEGLAADLNGRLYTIGFSGKLYSIQPGTGVATLVGPTGLDDCSTPASPCGRTSSLTLGSFGGKIYATDFDNRIYTVDPITGAATLIGPTGIPGVPFLPGTMNPDGTLNVYDQTIFGAGGQLYSTFSAFVLDLSTISVASRSIPAALYRIDPSTGVAMLVAPLTGPNADFAINGVFPVGGTVYGFDNLTSHSVHLDLQTGIVSLLGEVDSSAGVIRGAQAVPEPASVALTAFAAVLIIVCTRRRNRNLTRWFRMPDEIRIEERT